MTNDFNTKMQKIADLKQKLNLLKIENADLEK